MKDIEEKIEKYITELYEDLGFVDLPEEKKADIFARVEEHLHKVILEESREAFSEKDVSEIEKAIGQSDYQALDNFFASHPQHKIHLTSKIDKELDVLRQIIKEEQEYAE